MTFKFLSSKYNVANLLVYNYMHATHIIHKYYDKMYFNSVIINFTTLIYQNTTGVVIL